MGESCGKTFPPFYSESLYTMKSILRIIGILKKKKPFRKQLTVITKEGKLSKFTCLTEEQFENLKSNEEDI